MSDRSRTRTRRAPAAAALALAAVLVTGCSGGDEAGGMGGEAEETMSSSAPSEESAAEESPAAGSGGGAETEGSATDTSLEVSSVDFSYELAEDSVSPGTYEITLTNEGSSSHDLVVERDGEDVAASDVIDPGESTTFEVTLEEGEYVFYCSVGNHRGMGMEVPVEVTA